MGLPYKTKQQYVSLKDEEEDYDEEIEMIANPSHFKLKSSKAPRYHNGDSTSNNAFDDADDEGDDDYESLNDEAYNKETYNLGSNFTRTGEVTIENPQLSGNPSITKFH